jgi:uncharacterized protein with HEPN domain
VIVFLQKPKRSIRTMKTKTNAIRVQHMIDSATDAVAFAHGKHRKSLATDRQLVLALMKSIEIIGEAASQVTEEYQRQHAHVPWAILIATRHRLIHGYFDVDLDVVWNTVTQDLPVLLQQLRRI